MGATSEIRNQDPYVRTAEAFYAFDRSATVIG
jgi:hypothetical protein